MVNARDFEVFHAVMAAGSVTGAAKLLNVSQPAVTSAIKHFESRIKLQLFERAGGRLRPTREAEALFPDVAAIFGRLEALARLTQDLAGGRIGSLTLAAAFPIANGFLADAVASFMRAHPGVRVVLQSLTSPQVLAAVRSREVELGVVHVPVTTGGIATEMLGRWSIGCAMPREHRLTRRTEVRLQDLADEPLITYLPQIVFRPFIDRAFSEAGVTPDVIAQVSIALTGIVLAARGAGVALVDTMLLGSLSVPGVVVRPLVPAIEAQTLLLSLESGARSRMAAAFVDHLKRQLAPNDPAVQQPRRAEKTQAPR